MSESEADSAPAAAEPMPSIEGYAFERRIGRGGMATVYLARQLSLDRQVAIKVLASEAIDNPSQGARFEREARIIARLDHPGIVGIHEVGRLQSGQLYYVMPHLAGGDLASRDLREHPQMIISILRVLLQALSHAHEHGVVHRDVKPENVLFDTAGRPRLADFGIAIGRRRAAPRITREGMALGSSGFMAPEQARGEVIDGRADLYSVGVLAYQMLTGTPPFESEDELTLALMHAQDEPPRLPPAQRAWQEWLDRAMAKRPEDRYADADAMLLALGQIEQDLQLRKASSSGNMLSKVRWPVWSALAAALLLGGALVLNQWQTQAKQELASRETADALAELLATANAQLGAGALVAPSGANAAESYLKILRQQPGRADAINGVQRVFEGLAQQVSNAVAASDWDSVRERIQQAELLAEGLGTLGQSGRQTVMDAAQRAFDAEVAQAVASGDTARAQQALARYAEYGLDATAANALVTRVPPTGVVAAVDTPAVIASTSSPATGLNSRPVSVAEYRAFADATKRPSSRCRARLSPLQWLDKRNWREPGFAQTDTSPVVCISHADAEAYAAWRSKQDGRSWRLPSLAERKSTNAASQVAEWTNECADGRGCKRRIAFAGAGSAGQAEGAEQAREADRGFAEVGFRLLRER
ncbi:MAG: protein kinase domain-containing protein [Pseudomarimonas sp.]